MKVIFITATLSIIWYMRKHRTVSQTYCKEEDTFKMEYLIVPCFLLALLVNHELSVMEVRPARGSPPGPGSPLPPGALDVLHLPGGGGHPAAAGDAAELGECGQPDGPLRVLPGVSGRRWPDAGRSLTPCLPGRIARCTCSTGSTATSTSRDTATGLVRGRAAHPSQAPALTLHPVWLSGTVQTIFYW